MTTDAGAAKAALRARIRAERAALSEQARAQAGAAIRDVVLAMAEMAAASVVAAYVDMSGEPPTRSLIDALHRVGKSVLLPVQRPDGELDWAPYDGTFASGPHGIAEPTAARLGVDGIARADVVVVPALAVDRNGHRLGQGGGGYDRALPRTHAATVALVYDEEFLAAVPHESHDVPVVAVATPSQFHRCIDT